ncbi:MAG: PilZ domain-containing protein [Candidatus Omnitrophica bacterium]|nr:PilZ domain-containing protein [Candidatus Omnitrophota bacterium]
MSNEEKRKYKRVTASFPVAYVIDQFLSKELKLNERVDAVAIDLSQGGMAILTTRYIPAGSVVEMKFVMPQGSYDEEARMTKPIKIIGEVVYSFLLEKKGYRLGIRFLGLKPEEESLIVSFVKANSSDIRKLEDRFRKRQE